jgi:hypothetical protein
MMRAECNRDKTRFENKCSTEIQEKKRFNMTLWMTCYSAKWLLSVKE